MVRSSVGMSVVARVGEDGAVVRSAVGTRMGEEVGGDDGEGAGYDGAAGEATVRFSAISVHIHPTYTSLSPQKRVPANSPCPLIVLGLLTLPARSNVQHVRSAQ